MSTAGNKTATPKTPPPRPSKKVTTPDGDGGRSSGSLAAAKNRNVAGWPTVLGLFSAVSWQLVVGPLAAAGGANGPTNSALLTKAPTSTFT